MAMELDRNGVPQYDGSPETLNGHEERAWDLCWGRLDKPAERASTALHLRSGLSGPANEAVRKLRHQDLITRDQSDEMGKQEPTEDGVRLLLNTLKGEIHNIAPVRSNEIFDKALCGQTVWRGKYESMANYVTRRRKEFAELCLRHDCDLSGHPDSAHLQVQWHFLPGAGLRAGVEQQQVEPCWNGVRPSCPVPESSQTSSEISSPSAT